MKAHLAEWISKGVTIMNEKKREKVVHCWEKTGLLAIWDVNERAVLTPQGFSQTAHLFPGHHNDDNSGVGNEVDDSAPKLLLQDLLCFALVTIMCFADVSGGAGGVVGEEARSGAGEGARGLTRGGVSARGGERRAWAWAWAWFSRPCCQGPAAQSHAYA